MSTATDTFVSFVDTLADRLDDHEATGEQLAARAYLSRFHFDRVVAATAGETPARVPAARAARTVGVPAADDAVQRPRRRGRSGLLQQRGVHACVPAGVRRRTGGLAQAAAPQHPARDARTASTSIPLAASGCLLERRSLPWICSSRWSSTTSGWSASSPTAPPGSTTTPSTVPIEVSVDDGSRRLVPALVVVAVDRPDGHVELRARQRGLRLGRRDRRTRRVDAIEAGPGRPDLSRPHPRGLRTGSARRDLRRCRCATRQRCSPTGGWSPTC